MLIYATPIVETPDLILNADITIWRVEATTKAQIAQWSRGSKFQIRPKKT